MNRTIDQIQGRASALNVNHLSAKNANHLSEVAQSFLLSNYPELGLHACYRLLSEMGECYSKGLISKYARDNNLKRVYWTPEEESVLLANYTPDKIADLEELIPNHSKSACVQHAKIKFNLGYPNTVNYWTTAEDDIIRDFYPNGGAEACLQYLSSRDVAKIRDRASKLGIKYLGPHYKTGTAIRCVETGEVFARIKDAKALYNGDISACLRGAQKATKQPDGTKLHWEYVEEKEN